MNLVKLILLGLAFGLGWSQQAAFAQQAGANPLEELVREVKQRADRSEADNAERVKRFTQNRDQQLAILRQARQELAGEEARSAALKRSYDDNERALEKLSETLRIRIGDFGELFGVVRQVAGDTKGIVRNSLVSAQYPERAALANRLAAIKGLPSIDELNKLRVLLMDEAAQSAAVVRFPAVVKLPDGRSENLEVVRVGVFNALVNDSFLRFEPETRSLQMLDRQPASRYRALAQETYEAPAGTITAMAVDPSRGSILGLLIQAPTLAERIEQGGPVGYFIMCLGLLGLLIAIERLAFLAAQDRRIKRQLGLEHAEIDNPLGRILTAYEHNSGIDTETLELKMDEAILKELPALEKRQGVIKVLAAVAPLLGLLGTVVGMIQTFQMITLFGTGDPKLMAGGISTALVTTVLGLIVAIPLVLLHTMVVSRSKRLVEILEQQSAGLVARHAEQGFRP